MLALLPAAAAAAFIVPAALAQNATSGINATAFLTSKLGISGTFNFALSGDNETVRVSYDVRGLDAAAQAGGNTSFQFLYHIHTNPVPSDGNCTGTLGHLDPFNLTDAVVCNATAPEYCQEGDLSGKHGRLAAEATVTSSYEDAYLRFWPEPLSLFGRSVTVHYPNKTRIACGNITSFTDGTADANGQPTNASSTYVKNYAAAAGPAGPAGPFTVSFSTSGAETAAYVQGTRLAALPDVASVPDAVLSTVSGVPTLAAATSSFTFSGQPISAFPTQSEAPFPSASAASGSASGSAPSASATSSAAGRVGLSCTALVVGAAAVFLIA